MLRRTWFMLIASYLCGACCDRPQKVDRSHEMVILITTNISPYNLHVPPLLSLPSGLPYHFRYRRNWVALDNKSLGDFVGKPGLIVFYLGGGRFVPLRSCTFYRSLDYGDVVFLDAQMGPLVDYSDDRFDIYDQVLAQTLFGGGSLQTLKKLVFETDKLSPADFKMDPEASASGSHKIWTNTALKLGQLPLLKTVAFFRVGLFDGAKAVRPAKLSENTFGYELRSGRAYNFDVFEYVGGMEPSEQIESAFDFEMQTDASLLSPLKPKERVDGAYDRFDLMFRTAQVLTNAETFVILNDQQKIVTENDHQKRSESLVPMIHIPIVIRNSVVKKAVAYIGTPLCILFFLIPQLAKTLLCQASMLLGVGSAGRSDWFELSNETIQAIAVLVFVGIIANWDFSSFVVTLREKLNIG